MLDEFNEAIKVYNQKWQKFVAGRKDQKYFTALKPTAVAWKTADLAEFDKVFKSLRTDCDQIHLAWLNGRWLATMVLRDQTLEGGIKIVKLMQRRPKSTDALGLDHLDFLHTEDAETVLKAEDIKWSRENNGDNCSWLSIWFDGTEAKLRTNTVLDVCIAELTETNQTIKS